MCIIIMYIHVYVYSNIYIYIYIYIYNIVPNNLQATQYNSDRAANTAANRSQYVRRKLYSPPVCTVIYVQYHAQQFAGYISTTLA